MWTSGPRNSGRRGRLKKPRRALGANHARRAVGLRARGQSSGHCGGFFGDLRRSHEDGSAATVHEVQGDGHTLFAEEHDLLGAHLVHLLRVGPQPAHAAVGGDLQKHQIHGWQTAGAVRDDLLFLHADPCCVLCCHALAKGTRGDRMHLIQRDAARVNPSLPMEIVGVCAVEPLAAEKDVDLCEVDAARGKACERLGDKGPAADGAALFGDEPPGHAEREGALLGDGRFRLPSRLLHNGFRDGLRLWIDANPAAVRQGPVLRGGRSSGHHSRLAWMECTPPSESSAPRLPTHSSQASHGSYSRAAGGEQNSPGRPGSRRSRVHPRRRRGRH
mmetsp:Transcript_118940/g.379267  ORF Transcript_118940/g.379267 Transcript_118940/m.379267 type:complete len:331 (+) Transcript_118940:36-1028(+)